MKLGYQRNIGDIISIRNYVGLIQMKKWLSTSSTSEDCISSGIDEENAKTKKIFLKMLCAMKEFPGKVFNEAALNVDKMNLYELFINMYLQEVRQLVKRGIKSEYIEQTDNVRYYKGKLLVSPHIKTNLAHKERFFVSYEEFHPDRAENRLIKATLLKLQKLTASGELKAIIRLLIAF